MRFWRRKDEERPRGQYWKRNPQPTDALFVPDVNLVDDDKPAEVFPDEIDPAWADSDEPSDPDEPREPSPE